MEQHTLLYAWGITMSIIGTLIWQLPKRQSEDFTTVECMTIIPSFTTGMPPSPPPPKGIPCLWRGPNALLRFTPIVVGPDSCTWEHQFETLPRPMQQALLYASTEPPPYDTTVRYAPAFEVPDSQYVFAPFEVDRLPQFVGGEAAMMRFIRENLHWPKTDFCGGGTIVAQFTIGLDGCITDPLIIKDIGRGMGKAAIHMLYAMPPWLPGAIAGRTVKVRYIMPIRIHLE